MPSFDLETTYLSLDPDGHVTPLPVGPEFWKTIGENKAIKGALVTVSKAEGDWTHWEMHPHGDEVLVLLEGETRIVFERPAGRKESFDLKAGSTLVVPAGTWHRAENQRQVRMLFITHGTGTEHKPV
jgi:mannose-6-phosphate isomerase-like protein (cupin superfamily)